MVTKSAYSDASHLNGGIEQAFLELANEDNLLSDAHKQRLEFLKSLPQNRIEYLGRIESPSTNKGQAVL